MNDEKRELPDLGPELAYRISGQMAGALAVLYQEEDLWSTSDALQTIQRLLMIGIELADEAAEVINEYIVSVDRMRRSPEGDD